MMHLLGTSASVLSTSRVLLALIPLVMVRLGLPLSDEIRRLGLSLAEARTIVLRGIGIGYGCAWIGHFFVEKNRPATFKVRADDNPSMSFDQADDRNSLAQYPLMSFMGDLRMLWEVVTLRRSI
jgi:hypothetical protein